ncbi:MAG: (d)CMP kinase [Ktedonobacterales bacterium]|nr:(d)CMP kinase [Ktedonobacterales bacterium]
MTAPSRAPLHIAIDGPVASGKSTVGKAVADRLGILYVDTGITYRAVALVMLEQGHDPADGALAGQIAETLDLRIEPTTVADGRQNTVLLGDRDITWAIRTPAVNRIVPIVAGHAQVRHALHVQQRSIAAGRSVVMVGRDITSIVLPTASVKIWLDASPDERVQRRAAEMHARDPHAMLDLPGLRQSIIDRDQMDAHNMLVTPDTHIINTDGKTVADVVSEILEVVHEQQ